MTFESLWASLLAALFTVAGLWLILRTSLGRFWMDLPNERSLHSIPKPRVGGVVMAVSVLLVTTAFLNWTKLQGEGILALALAIISFADDRYRLSAAFRLCAHLAAAAGWLLWIQREPHAEAWSTVLWGVALVLAICWMTNLYNFMDGADGLAGGMAAIGFSAYAFVASTSSLPVAREIEIVACALAGAAVGFLFFNTSPARIFMGDAGSIPLGFLAATLGLRGSVEGLWPWWFWPLTFSPFIVDATTTLIKRVARGEKIWQAHREHYYQRLILAGWSHRRTIAVYYFLMLASALSAVAALETDLSPRIIGAWVITYAVLLTYLERRFDQNKKTK